MMKLKSTLLIILFLVTAGLGGCSAKAAPPPDSPWGVAAHPWRDMKNLDLMMGLTANAGFRWMREDFGCSTVCLADGKMDFSVLDKIVDEAGKNHLQILPILQWFSWKIGGVEVPADQRQDIWKKFVQATVNRYHDRIKVWEIWNEEDGGFWHPKPSAKDYTTFLKIAYQEIKQVDPQAKVMIGGLCSWNGDFLQGIYDAGGKGYFDIIAVHPYDLEPAANDYQRIRMDAFKQVLAKNGQADMPIWITESGTTTPATDLQLKYPQFIFSAIQYAQKVLKHPTEKALRAGVLVSSDQLPASWPWLRGVNVQLINNERLKNLDPKDCPTLFIASQSIYDYQVEPLRNYIERGGLVAAVQKLPFYYVYQKDAKDYWEQKQEPDQTYPLFRMGYEAWWTNKALPESTFDVRLAPGLADSGITPVQNVYADRFFTNKNLHPGDKFIPLLDAYDKNGKSLAHAAALYTYGDWKGGILACAPPLRSTTEAEQANLIQRSTLSYLAAGVEKVFVYDLRDDGIDPLEREHNFGILHNDYTPKTAYYAYSTMTRQLGGTPSLLKRSRRMTLISPPWHSAVRKTASWCWRFGRLIPPRISISSIKRPVPS